MCVWHVPWANCRTVCPVKHRRPTEISRVFFINLEDALHRRKRAICMKCQRYSRSKLTRLNHRSPRRSSLRILYSHQVRRSNDERAPARNIKPGNNVWSSWFLRNSREIISSVSSTTQHTASARVKPKTKKKKKEKKKESGVRKQVGERFICSRALPFPSSQRLLRTHLSSIKCQADHIDAPPSPRQSLISEQTPTLLRTANSVREAGDALAASLRWLAETVRHSYPRSQFSSMSSSVGGEARCKKYPQSQVFLKVLT